MILHVFQQSMLLTAVLVGPVDGATSNIMDRALRNQKKLDLILWILNIGKYKLWPIFINEIIFTHFFSDIKSNYRDLDPPEIPNEEFEFCAGRPDMNDDGLTEGGEGTCQGDSGGPLICNDDGRPVVYGVTSWAQGCGKEGFPSIFAKVASVTDWIKEQM